MGGNAEPSRYPSSSSDRRPDSIDASNLTNSSRNQPRESAPTQHMQQPFKSSCGMSVFSRLIAESCVRARTPVRNDASWERAPQRSSTAMGSSGFDSTYGRNNYNSSQQPCNRNVQRSDDLAFGQRSEANRFRPNAYDEWNRPRSSASMRFGNTEYDERYSGARRDDNQRWSREENYYQKDASGPSRRDDNQRWPRNESFNRNYPGPTVRSDDRERASYHQSDTVFEERRDRYNNDAQYHQRNDVFRGNGERNNGGYRPQDMEYPSRNHSLNNSFVQPSAREERVTSDRFHDSSRQSFHDRAQYNGAARQGRSPPPSSTTPLTVDQRARLRIIHDFTFLHRHVNNSGFRSLDGLLSILPPDDSVDWVALIKDRLPEIELAPFKDSQVLLWREGGKSEHLEDKSFNI